MQIRASIIAATLVLSGCGYASDALVPKTVAGEVGEAEVAFISPAELANLIEQNKVVLIDVRTPAEFGEARLHGALNAPLQTFDPATIPMEAERETILYCRSSGRSGRAATILADHHQVKIRHLEGGILAWQEAGLLTIPEPAEAE
ncbi:rhodanese-like domain-containing protein [Pontixanthobacter aestiaquae]|uniref:Rhodanese-like domain-containing protein n=1 Tax=Pontixanthobacter aestiaquae TaxID=1509367 RepID=A0A844Z5Z9_9SPHN|nr:rhodanese-like domain-containing protein [Pontixanthobacter aestiaquae]MDN3646505.1 rhodanese-like domain-containing protein [Pontixanthobacter aestiaquae]MXO82507.1 rhodanese-like domain-containing protein [Pontixanthobacter aestiaquae]